MADNTAPRPAAEEESNVCVAVKIRPLVPSEIEDSCRETLFVAPGVPQVSTGQHTFSYDHVFGAGGSDPSMLYPKCVAPLVDGLFKGYNATVFAYGQTGSGKTYTMGSEFKAGGTCRGVIPDAINDIFRRIEGAKDCDITVRVSFVEIHKEEIKDLLLPAGGGARAAITIRETQSGGVALYGAVEREVRNRQEMAEVLSMGTLCRSTASTNMNNRSSRSHAIFSITLEQRRQVVQTAGTPTTIGEGSSIQGGDDDDDGDDDPGGEDGEGVEDYLCAKMHMVDLAGSERAKRTKAEGARLREGIHINRGLLALGNVINAIVDNHKHVPYRDSKLTRLLQDSLGGNSRTVMIACVSPADSNFEESLNTLRYADRARHIRNKPVVNRDPIAAQLATLRNTIAQLKGENVALRRALARAGGSEGAVTEALSGGGLGGGALDAVVERLQQENSSLEAENLRLKMDMEDLRREVAMVTDRWHTAQAQCDLLRMNAAAAAAAAASSEGGSGMSRQQEAALSAAANGSLPLPGLDIVKGYVARIAELEGELRSVKALASISFARRRNTSVSIDPTRTPGADGLSDYGPMSPGPDGLSPIHDTSRLSGLSGLGLGGEEPTSAEQDPSDPDNSHHELAAEEEFFMAELAAHTLNQEKMKKEVALLQKQLEAKERKMVELMKNAGSMPALKQHYDRVLAELEAQRDTLVAERKALMEKLAAVSAANEEERKRLEANYKERITQYDDRLKELRRKEREFISMQKLKQRTEEAHRRLSADITRLKQQKVAVQKQLDANAKQFAAWRAEREKELTQLRKQSRRDRAHIQQLEAIQAKQNAVLQRKISDANAARKKLKEYMEANGRRAAANAAAAANVQQAAANAAPTGNVEMQPNSLAPLLRTEKDRREWLVRELELCNMSSEFRKVIDGELAQRAEASRKLKELEKRLTVLDQLQPASPLLVAGAGGEAGTAAPDMSTLSPASAAAAGGLSLGPEGRAKLLARKKELEDKVAYHNAQVAELQAAWERQKAEEESRGGGAMDVRRWTGLRSVLESRELMRTLFRISVEAKCLNNDLTVDMERYMEEVDLLRVQLEGAQKKCAQYRKLAAALQAAAVHVASVPHHTNISTQDETDKQVDAVLEALHVVRSNTPAVSTSGAAQQDSSAHSAGGEDPAEGTPGTPTASRGAPIEPKVLDFLSPVPSGHRPRTSLHGAPSQRYSPVESGPYEDESDDEGDEDVEMEEAADAFADHSSGEEEDPMEEEDGHDDDSEDDSEDDDDDWDPSNPTPARKGRGARVSGRRSSALPAAVGSEVGKGTGRNSRRVSRDEEGTPAGADEGQARAATQGQRRSSAAGRVSAAAEGGGRRRGSSTTCVQDEAAMELERVVLDDLNLKRIVAGKQRVGKLTVALLKDALKGAVIDGQVWHAGSKNRAALIADYGRTLGIQPGQLHAQQQHYYHPSGPFAAPPLDPTSSGDVDMCDAPRTQNRGNNTVARSASHGGVASGGGGLYLGRSLGVAERNPGSPDEAGSQGGFTFSQPLQNAGSLGGPQPSPSPNSVGRRNNSAGSSRDSGSMPSQLGRSSLNAAQTSRFNWASSLRSSANFPTTAGAQAGAPAPAVVGNTALNRSCSSSSPAAATGTPGFYSSRRYQVWTQSQGLQNTSGANALRESRSSPAAGAVDPGANPAPGSPREALDYRSAVLSSPNKSLSPRASLRATFMRASTATPGHHYSRLGGGGDRPASASPGGWTASTPGSAQNSRYRASVGAIDGENRHPGATPGSAIMAASSEKTTPLTNLYKAKAEAARERTKALRDSMQRNWDQPLVEAAAAATGSVRGAGSSAGVEGAAGSLAAALLAGGMRTSAQALSSAASGGVTSSLDVGRAASLRELASKKSVPVWR